ncbi:MAG: glutamate racemase [Candidatus Paceibacterota bacterium]
MTNIGVFDSGVGGLWILKHLEQEIPDYNYIFFGDQGHVPYGVKSLDEIKIYSEEITKFLINKGCKIIVIACNTASAAALKYLREKFPDILFVGMEPAVKKAVEMTTTGVVGVLATPATFDGELYNSVVERFAQNVEIHKDTCLELVERIEKGDFDSKETKIILENALKPMLLDGIDTVVLGCTHYPFVIPAIKAIVGSEVNVIDPTPAIVRQVSHLLTDSGLISKNKDEKKISIFTSRDGVGIKIILEKLFNKEINVMRVDWTKDLKINNYEAN